MKDLVLIVQHNQEREQRLTGAKLVDIWRTRSPGVSRPGNVSSAYHLNTEFCERILVTALLKGVFKVVFHIHRLCHGMHESLVKGNTILCVPH